MNLFVVVFLGKDCVGVVVGEWWVVGCEEFVGRFVNLG